MKKKVLFLASYLSLFSIFIFNAAETKNVPDALKGIWEGKDRYVLFPENTIALKTFYAWYIDRAAESDAYSTSHKRDKNNTTNFKTPERLEITYNVLFENEEKNCGAYEINVFYYGKGKTPETTTIPVAVIDKKLYLGFLLKKNIEENNVESENIEDAERKKEFMNGFWKNHGHANAIKISPPLRSKELYSYYFNENDVYHIRYWLSDMEVTEEQIAETKASFSDGEKVFHVDKFIKNGDLLYTCTTGRSTTIRNISKTSAANLKFIVNTERTICVLEDEYLTKIDEASSIESLQKIVSETNAKKKSTPKPLFPPSDINFHWKEIGELEKYNPWTWTRRNIDIHK